MDTPSQTQSPSGGNTDIDNYNTNNNGIEKPSSVENNGRPQAKKRQHSLLQQEGARRKRSSSIVKSSSSKKSKSSSSQSKSTTKASGTQAAAAAPANSSDKEPEDEDDEIITGGGGAADTAADDQADREKLRLLLANFTEDQQSRYVAYRRANINRTATKRLANAVLNQSISANVAIVISGIAKVFVGDVVDYARRAQAHTLKAQFYSDPNNHNQLYQPPKILPPLEPQHIRDGWRLYKLESGVVPAAQWRRQGGSGDGLFFR